MLIKYKNKLPIISNTSFIAKDSKLIGDVTIGAFSSVWFNVVIRGDVAPVTIGNNSNIQDSTVIHTSRLNGPTLIGNNVTIGHSALLHACTIQDFAFIGMGSLILDRATIESYAFVGAGSLVSSNTVVKSYELWYGRPAKFIRELSTEEIEMIKSSAENYKQLALDYIPKEFSNISD